jgi:ribosome-associated toxin RatA of RatAB toxin-antitoxin module
MFAVVTAVEHYHKFVPWCQRSKILVRNKDHTYLEAELEVGFQVFSERYTLASAWQQWQSTDHYQCQQ